MLGLRAALIVMVSIPLSLAIGVALLQLFGFSLNQLSIVGFVIALGLLVDDSIVVTENVTRFLRAGATRREALILWAGVVPALLPVLLTIGTGALQFGHRYSADLQPLLIPLAWLGAGQRFSRVGYALLAASLAMNALGAAWFVSRYAS